MATNKKTTRDVLIIKVDVTALDERERAALAGEMAVQAEAGDDHPDARVLGVATTREDAVEPNGKDVGTIAHEVERWLLRRASSADHDIANFRRALADDACDALVHSREGIIAGVKKQAFDDAATTFCEARTHVSQEVGDERALTDEEYDRAVVVALREVLTYSRAKLFRVARDLASERDAHRLLVCGARAAALAEIVETIEDEVRAAGVAL